MNRAYQILVLIFLIGFSNSIAQKPQELSSKNKKAIKFFNEGKGYYDARNNDLAEVNFLSAIQKDSNFIEAQLLLAYVYTEMIQYKKALKHYDG